MAPFWTCPVQIRVFVINFVQTWEWCHVVETFTPSKIRARRLADTVVYKTMQQAFVVLQAAFSSCEMKETWRWSGHWILGPPCVPIGFAQRWCLLAKNKKRLNGTNVSTNRHQIRKWVCSNCSKYYYSHWCLSFLFHIQTTCIYEQSRPR